MDHSLCKDCKGFCCDDIGLSSSPGEIKSQYNAYLKGREVPEEDIEAIHNMLVYSHNDFTHPDGDLKECEDHIYHYRCTHHNKKTGNCDIYENRPKMCSEHPISGFCGYSGVMDQRVTEIRPVWFSPGMTLNEWNSGWDTEVKADEIEK